MKRGDIVRREKTYEKGTSICTNISSKEQADNWMQHEFSKHYQTNDSPTYDIISSENNTTKFDIVTTRAFITKEDAKVNWVIDQEAAISFIHEQTMHLIINTEDEDWKVIQESTPSYQSQVASMSDEELKAAIDVARYARATIQPKKALKASQVIDPLEAKLASLSAEDRQKIMIKLGLI